MGRTQFRDNLAVAAEDYTDWSVAVSRSFGPAEVSLGYFGTDASARASFGKLADNRLLLSSLPIDRHRRQNEKGAGRRLFRISAATAQTQLSTTLPALPLSIRSKPCWNSS